MVWYSTETVMALHRARLADERRSAATRRRSRERRPAATGPLPATPAVAR